MHWMKMETMLISPSQKKRREFQSQK